MSLQGLSNTRGVWRNRLATREMHMHAVSVIKKVPSQVILLNWFETLSFRKYRR